MQQSRNAITSTVSNKKLGQEKGWMMEEQISQSDKVVLLDFFQEHTRPKKDVFNGGDLSFCAGIDVP